MTRGKIYTLSQCSQIDIIDRSFLGLESVYLSANIARVGDFTKTMKVLQYSKKLPLNVSTKDHNFMSLRPSESNMLTKESDLTNSYGSAIMSIPPLLSDALFCQPISCQPLSIF